LWVSSGALSPTPNLSPPSPPQVRSLTNARCAAKPSARAPTSSPTAASTQGTSPSPAPCAPRASSARWTCGATRRPTAACVPAPGSSDAAYNNTRAAPVHPPRSHLYPESANTRRSRQRTSQRRSPDA
uniref:Uncharacterized protein n=1 Tax=Terrapene triunguis TaxID=2587831 RepID=A0A674JGQ0_9SAUR